MLFVSLFFDFCRNLEIFKLYYLMVLSTHFLVQTHYCSEHDITLSSLFLLLNCTLYIVYWNQRVADVISDICEKVGFGEDSTKSNALHRKDENDKGSLSVRSMFVQRMSSSAL